MPTYCIDLTAYNTLARQRGIGRYLYFLARGLEALKPELDRDERFVGLVRTGGDRAFTENLDLDQHRDPLPPLPDQDEHFSRYFKTRRTRVGAALRRLEPDVVHFAEGPAAFVVPGAKTVVTCHDLIPLLMADVYLGKSPFAKAKRRRQDALAYRRASRVIAISDVTRQSLVDELGVPAHRIAVIQQGVDHDAYGPAAPPDETERLRAVFGLPTRYFLYVGAADVRKRVDLLIAAQRRIYEQSGVPLVLVGPCAHDRHVRPLVEALPRGACIPVGVVDDDALPALYRQADLLVMPSVYEGFGLPVLEAMLSGCPVVTTDGGALGEVAGDAARRIPTDDRTALERAVISLLADPDERRRLRARGLERAQAFRWSRCARATLEVYRWAVGRSAASLITRVLA